MAMTVALKHRNRLRTQERGAILPLMAIMLVVLLGAAAMAVDLGWLFWQSIEIQHGADAAALAGVIYEPDLRTEAHTEALATAVVNGYDDGASGTTVTVLDYDDDPTAVENSSQLRVTITDQVDTFFMKVFGLGDVDIARTAVAEYTPPLLMGSRDSTFGRDYSQYAPGDAADPGYWANITGTWGPKSWGDRYGSACMDKSNYSSGTDYGSGYGQPCTTQPEIRFTSNWGAQSASGGYLYGINVPAGSTGLSVEIFDGPLFDQRRYGSGTHSDDWTGDYWPTYISNISYTANFYTWFMLYAPDPTPLNTTDNELLCTVRYGAIKDSYRDGGSSHPGDDDGGRDVYYPAKGIFWDAVGWSEYGDIPAANIATFWDDMATSDEMQTCQGNWDKGAGIYPLRVVVEDHPDAYGFNKYSLRVSSASGPQPSVSAMTDMSIFANDVQLAGTEFDLALVEPKYAGKDLVVEVFDAGDGPDTGSGDYLEIWDGAGSPPANCTWEEWDNEFAVVASGTGCSYAIDNGAGDNRYFVFTIPLADDYTCSGNGCWWEVHYFYNGGGQLRDVTTWKASIGGNPIRIVE